MSKPKAKPKAKYKLNAKGEKLYGHKPTQMRLSPADKKMIEDLRKWFGLPTMVAAVRHIVQIVHRDELESRQEKKF